MRALLPITLTLAACGSDSAIFDDELSCDANPYSWFDPVVGSLMQADDQGVFNYDPPGLTIDLRDGSYDLETGDFAWVNTYAEGYTTEQGGTEGYGTVFSNGDVDLLYKSQATDILGEQTAVRSRTERTACEGYLKTWTVDVDAALGDEPSDDPFVWNYTIESADQVVMATPDGFEWERDSYVATRTLTSDLDSTTELDRDDGATLATTVSHGDGTWESDSETHDTDYDIFRTTEGEFDGSWTSSFDAYEAEGSEIVQSCTYAADYAGDGGGTCGFLLGDGSWIDCDLTLESGGGCTYDCGEYGEYDCSS